MIDLLALLAAAPAGALGVVVGVLITRRPPERAPEPAPCRRGTTRAVPRPLTSRPDPLRVAVEAAHLQGTLRVHAGLRQPVGTRGGRGEELIRAQWTHANLRMPTSELAAVIALPRRIPVVAGVAA